MLSLTLYPADFLAMLGFLSRISTTQLDVPVCNQPVSIAVLMAYQSRLTFNRIFSWKNRKKDRTYRYNMLPFVALALYSELKKHPLTPAQQSLLNRLDQALINYRLPLGERLVLTTNLLQAAHA